MTDTLIAQMQMGERAREFWDSEIGRYVLERAQQDIDYASAALEEADAEDPATIRDLQFKIRVARAIPLWLHELIMEGKQAQQVLDEGEGP